MVGKLVIGTELDTKSFEKQIEEVEYRLKQIDEELAHKKELKLDSRTIKEYELEAEKLNNQLNSLYKKQRRINNQGFNNMKQSIENVGNSINGVIKKVTRWGLAIFGVRSAYLAIRSSMSILSESDENLKTNIDYIRWALANTLKPIIEWIVNAVYTILQLIGQIVQLFTGYNIFQNSGIKDYQKAMKSSSKSAKELKKTIASFDELNVLQDNTNSGTSGITPNADLSQLGKVPEWMENLLKAKDFIGEILPIILSIFAILFKIKKLGIFLAIMGIYKTIQSIIKWLKEPTFENFMGILQGIALTVTGIAIAFGAWPVAIGAALALVVTTIIKNWDKIKEWLWGFVEWIDTSFRETLRKLFGPIGDIVADAFKLGVETIIKTFDGLIQSLKRIYNGIIMITQGDLVGGLKEIFGGMIDILLWPFNTLINFIKGLWDTISKPIKTLVDNIKKALGFEVDMKYKFSAGGGGAGAYGGGGGGGGFNRAKGGVFYPSKLPKLAVGGIINRPGPGVPYNGAIIGERGAEAVVPLTDTQQMELLGATIGRNITIELTNITELDGRQIARKVDKIQQNNNFVLNR